MEKHPVRDRELFQRVHRLLQHLQQTPMVLNNSMYTKQKEVEMQMNKLRL